MRGRCALANGEGGGLASTSPQAETAGGESCSFSGFDDYVKGEDGKKGVRLRRSSQFMLNFADEDFFNVHVSIFFI